MQNEKERYEWGIKRETMLHRIGMLIVFGIYLTKIMIYNSSDTLFRTYYSQLNPIGFTSWVHIIIQRMVNPIDLCVEHRSNTDTQASDLMCVDQMKANNQIPKFEYEANNKLLLPMLEMLDGV